MVGVPGKSKGCSTCRRRKKGCDQKRPICGQCASSGYVCGGYQRDLTFIAHPSVQTLDKAVFLPVRPAPPQLPAAPSLDRSAIISQCRQLFFEVFMPFGRCLCRDEQILRCRHPMSVTEVIPHVIKDETSLQAAFSALTISRVGRSNNDARLVKESTKFYGKALKSLQFALSRPGQMDSEQVLAACLLLAYYEGFENVSGKSIGWMNHAEGAARVLQMRGPEAHRLERAHHLWLGARPLILYSAMLRRRRTFMEDPDWLLVPWQQSQYRTGVDVLIDIVTKVPGCLQDLDELKAAAPIPDRLDRLIACLESCMSIQKGLAIWDVRRKPSSAPMMFPHESAGKHDDYPFIQDIIFVNHLFFNANMIWWVAHLVLATAISELQVLISDARYPKVDNAQAVAIAEEQARQAATNLAQSIPYGLRFDMGQLGLWQVAVPMSLLYDYFLRAEDYPVCQWLIKLYRERKHMGLHVASIENDLSTGFSGHRAQSRTMHRISSSKHTQRYATPPTDSRASNSSESRSELSRFLSIEPDFPSRFTTFPPSPSSSPGTMKEEGSIAATWPITSHSSRGATDEFDPDYDVDSDVDSPVSQERATGSRQSSVTSVPRQLRLLQKANAEKGEFTFVKEDPSAHYIVSD